MASSSRRKHGKDVAYSYADRIGNEVDEIRNWTEDLPNDIAVTILQRVGSIDILENVQRVCTTWRKLCRDPALWRSIDMSICGDTKFLSLDLVNMTKHAIDRSCGELTDIKLEYCGTDDLLMYIAYRTNKLRSLQIVQCWDISDEGLSEATRRLPSLEQLHIHFTSITKKSITVTGLENVAQNCPNLKSFTFNQKGITPPNTGSTRTRNQIRQIDNEEAAVISRSMPSLNHLSLVGHRMTNQGLNDILNGCPHLESLDLRKCFGVKMNREMRRRCLSIKRFRHPKDSIAENEIFGESGYVPLAKRFRPLKISERKKTK